MPYSGRAVNWLFWPVKFQLASGAASTSMFFQLIGFVRGATKAPPAAGGVAVRERCRRKEKLRYQPCLLKNVDAKNVIPHNEEPRGLGDIQIPSKAGSESKIVHLVWICSACARITVCTYAAVECRPHLNHQSVYLDRSIFAMN